MSVAENRDKRIIWYELYLTKIISSLGDERSRQLTTRARAAVKVFLDGGYMPL